MAEKDRATPSQIKILAIDDEPQITRYLQRLLTPLGFEVVPLNDSTKVEEQILYRDINMVITDLNMPNRNGLEVLRIIRLNRPEVPVIMLTGYGTIDSAVEASKLGVAEFLAKPIDKERIVSLVKKYAMSDLHLPDRVKNMIKSRTLATKPAHEQEKIVLKEEIVTSGSIPEGFVEVPFENVVPGETIPFNFYIQLFNKADGQHYLRRLLKKDSMYTAALHNILSQRRLSRVYIHESDYREYFRYYSNLKLLPSLRDAKIKDEKQMVLYGKAIEAVTELLTKPINKENIQEAIYLVDDLFRKMVKDQDSYADMYKLFQHSHNVFNHSANVCLLTISFGLYLKLKPEALNILGLGALYHDVGLINIPKDILIKTTPLTTGEWLLIKEHPQLGVRQLQGALIFPRESLRVVAEHHEETDGSGYPKGLTRGHISLLSRICRIADKFDSMTAIKPYRAAFPPADALKEIYIKESSDDVRKLIRSFIEFLGGKKRPERS